MKRKIKFRGKAVNDGRWLYGVPTIDMRAILNDDQPDSPDAYEVDPDTVGQFTGLCDRNGKEIYEGDIMHRVGESDNSDVNYFREVVFCDGFFGLHCVILKSSFPLSHYDIEKWDVLGNIFDSPEFLKEEAK